MSQWGPQSLLYDNAFWSVLEPDADDIIRVIRHRVPFESKAQCDEVTQPIQDVCDDLGRADYKLLIDSRNAPPRNDPAYEAFFEEQRNTMVLGFRRVAVVVRTMVGVLQTKRLSTEVLAAEVQADRLRVFSDEREAFAYLREDE